MRKQSAVLCFLKKTKEKCVNKVQTPFFLPRFCLKFGIPKMSGNRDILTQKKKNGHIYVDIYIFYILKKYEEN